MPPSLTWHTFPSPSTQAAALAEAVANCLRDCLHTQGHAVLAVSGGRSPIAFFEALSQAKLDWPNVTITLVDERLVPPQHADSNAVLVHRHLLQHTAAAARFLPLVGEQTDVSDPAAALAEAETAFPTPDIAVLGMGADGHTASLFPQAPQLAAAVSPECRSKLVHTSPITARRRAAAVVIDSGRRQARRAGTGRCHALERTPHQPAAASGKRALPSVLRRLKQQSRQRAFLPGCSILKGYLKCFR